MNNPVVTKDYALKILKRELPGLFALNFKGNFGNYVKTEVIFAENCQLFGFIIYDSSYPELSHVRFEKNGEVDDDEVLLYTYDINIKSDYELKRVS